MTSLKDKRVLVVGGARGIGAELARRAADDGADVVVAARAGGDVVIDVQDEATIAAAAAQVGAVDHVLSTASAHHDVPVTELENAKIATAFGTKVFGPLLLAKHLTPLVRPGGSLLFFSGIIGWKPKPGTVVKGTANGALEYLVKHLAVELAPVRVNAIAPGVINSGAWDGLDAAKRTALFSGAAANSLAGRVGSLEDVADAALWLLGAGYVTGN